jgi:hypothetical protein
METVETHLVLSPGAELSIGAELGSTELGFSAREFEKLADVVHTLVSEKDSTDSSG